MNENLENLFLSQLREIRAEIGTIRSDVPAIRSDLADVDQKVDGLAVMLTMLAGHVPHTGEPVETLESTEGGRT